MVTPSDVITEARKWEGTPYQHQGRVLGIACDCIGLVIGVCKALGLPHEDRVDYQRVPDGVSLQASLDQYCDRVDEIEPGVLLLFRIRKAPQHVGLVTNTGLIHAHYSSAYVTEHELDPKWRDRIIQVYRLRGVNYG
jgi:NlpC/P60 family putative phage cell wall peptidase